MLQHIHFSYVADSSFLLPNPSRHDAGAVWDARCGSDLVNPIEILCPESRTNLREKPLKVDDIFSNEVDK